MFMELPVSGLHRLFHTNPSSSNFLRDQAFLESVTEEAHTRELLYPTLEALLNPQCHAPLSHVDPASAPSTANTFDEWGELGIDSGKIRVLVAQDGNAISQQPRVLYDSQPTGPDSRPFESPDPTKRDNTSSTTRKDQIRIIPSVIGDDMTKTGRPASHSKSNRSPPLLGGVPSQTSPIQERGGVFPNPKLRRDSFKPTIDCVETTHAKLARESREETDTMLGCMFGFTGLPLVSSTKIHVNPYVSTKLAWNVGSIPRSHEMGPHRPSAKSRTPLNRSMTTEGLQRIVGSATDADIDHSTMGTGSPSILITRVFSVERPNSVTIESIRYEPSGGYQQEGAPRQSEIEKVKQVKVPRYAVSLVLRVPRTRQRYQGSSSLSDTFPNGSSEDSNISRTHPTVDLGASIPDHDIERIIAHWNVLTRVLSSLEAVARHEIQRLLAKADQHEASQPTPASNAGTSSSPPSPRQKKPKQSSQRTVQLRSLALRESSNVATAACIASYRVSYAMKIRRVIAGQGRWGVWREEARWVGQWANGKEQNFFLFNLLTAFLGNHVEWLDILGHEWNEQKRSQQDTEESHPIRHRTLIVSTNKMAARRLVFLLSTFLPSTSAMAHRDGPDRPLSSRSSSGLSQSPPFGAPPSREVSLRRTINRRPRGNRTNNQIHSHERSVSFSTADSPIDDDHLDRPQGHNRRTSDARSIRSLALPIPLSNHNTRKSSITIDSTADPRSDVPVPYFSGLPSDKPGTSAAPRPGSSGSLASLSLRRTLSRSDSSGGALSPESPTTSRWGSMLSGFWSARRGSSTEGTDGLASPYNGLGISGMSHSTSPRSPSKLAPMVEQAAYRPSPTGGSDQDTLQGPPSPGTITEATPAKDIPERQNPKDYPLELSIDTSDGVVDVDLPATKSYPSSFNSSADSPQMANTASSSFNDHSSLYGRKPTQSSLPSEIDSSIDVAGWLRRYHQDFALQAVRPYKTLIEEVKHSMRDESTPTVIRTAEWTDICTTLIADTTNFSITRLTLRRKYASQPVEERLIEEPLMDLDSTLVDAVERVLAQSGHSSCSRSRAPSPSHHYTINRQAHGTNIPLPEIPHSECKKIVLGALEEVVRSVSAEWEHEGRGKDITRGNDRSGVVDSTLREGVRRWLEEGVTGGSEGR